MRRELSTIIVNEELRSLFPHGSVPAIVIEKQPADVPEDGSIRLGSRRLEVKERFLNSTVDGAIELTGVLIHELKNAEQSGLLIRNFIDDVVPTGSNATTLTEDQKERISSAFKNAQGNNLRPDVLDEVFAQRAGELRRRQYCQLQIAPGSWDLRRILVVVGWLFLLIANFYH